MVVTADDLSPGNDIPEPMVVVVRDVTWKPSKSRRAEVELTDRANNPLRLVDYDGAEISVKWKENHRFRIARCKVQRVGKGHDVELAPSKRTTIEPLGPDTPDTQILVIGDTHVGRTEHPKSGEKINPIGAFSRAVDYGIEQAVDAVIHVGDIFHESAGRVQALLVDQLVFDQLAKVGIPFYYIKGNHESPPGNEVLANREGDYVTHLDAAGVQVSSSIRLFGVDHYSGGAMPFSNIGFPDTVSEPVSVLILHQTLKQLSGHKPESVDLNQIVRRCGGYFDMVLSGHHHDAHCATWQDVPVIYTGASERMSTNDEPVDRVAWMLSVDGDQLSFDQYDIPLTNSKND